MKINRQKMKVGETTEQIKLISWAKSIEDFVPELKLLFHVPNEGLRRNGNLLKAMGMKKGVPDLFLPVIRNGYVGLAIEMKYGDNVPTKEQRAYMSLLEEYGWKVNVCYSYEQAREIIRHYLARAEDFDLVNCEEAEKRFNRCLGIDVSWAPCAGCVYYAGNNSEKRK